MGKIVILILIFFSTGVQANELNKNLNRGMIRERLLDQQQRSLDFWRNSIDPNQLSPRGIAPVNKDSYLGCHIDLDSKILSCPKKDFK